MFQDGNLNRHNLIEVVAEREGKTVEEIYDTLKLLLPEQPEPIQRKEPEPSLEELIQAYIQVEEHEQEARWTKGKLFDVTFNAGAKQKWLSSLIGVSPAQIRELVKVYRTFPKESMRIPSLSWYHYRVATNSDKPQEYIIKANNEQLSTRKLKKVILPMKERNISIKMKKKKR